MFENVPCTNIIVKPMTLNLIKQSVDGHFSTAYIQ